MTKELSCNISQIDKDTILAEFEDGGDIHELWKAAQKQFPEEQPEDLFKAILLYSCIEEHELQEAPDKEESTRIFKLGERIFDEEGLYFGNKWAI